MPQTSRSGIALALIGASVMGTVFMGVVATQNFYTIDRLLASHPNPSFEVMVEDLGPVKAREFLRYLSSELNRLLFQVWGWTEVALGAVVYGLLRRSPRRRIRYAALGLWGVAAFMTIALIPPIVSIGRDLDFVPREPPPPGLARFGLLHAAYTVMDAVKLGLAVLLAVGLVRAPES